MRYLKASLVVGGGYRRRCSAGGYVESLAGFYAVCDAAFLNLQGIPSIVYGPGSLLVAHAVDEFIDIDELMVSTKTYALATMDWCGVSS